MTKAKQRRKKRHKEKLNGRDWRKGSMKVEDLTRRSENGKINGLTEGERVVAGQLTSRLLADE